MPDAFEIFDPARQPALPAPALDAMAAGTRAFEAAQHEMTATGATARILMQAAARHGERIARTHSARTQAGLGAARDLGTAMGAALSAGQLGLFWADYLRDAAERAVLTADVLRQRGDVFLEHEAAGCPPVLVYDTEVVMDGADLPHPANYVLLRILPPEGVVVNPCRRPYVVIDPRAGHGPGIGGFKTDSQVGVALRAGHPVYFVAFRREPEPGQYLSYVTRAEAAFVREVMRRHPEASKPVVIGNCQGGWAALLLAATNPDLTGPVVVNGAPVAPWAGIVGENPMRYNAGVLGGTWIPMFLSDLGGGLFDGAHLVQNFEMMNPARTLYRKYTDLFRDIDTAGPGFLEFERWWGGYFLLAEPEIRWIVEQLFVGNRLVKNEARIEPGRPVDLKAIRAPIIVFASHGDNITPPQQALNWIVETYADVSEIRIRGQRILYMVHDRVGHLGIFVSSRIARKEHTEMASTLKTIEALAPGLYEMRIEDVEERDGHTHFTVGFAERSFDDIRALDDGHDDERPFAAVARASEVQAQVYDAMVRPVLRSLVTDSVAEMGRALHPQRLSRALMSSRNPATGPLASAAEKLRETRRPAAPDNPFLAAEALWVETTEQAIDLWRDLRDMSFEIGFHMMWGNPWARAFGRSHEARRTLKDGAELRALPEVTAALFNIDRGGFAEAVIRMLILLADSRGTVRRDRLERSSRVLTRDDPFRSLGAAHRAMVINEQTLIASYEPERAIETLPLLLNTPEERRLAAAVVQFIPGAIEEMSPRTLELLQRFRAVLDLGPITEDVTEDPLVGGFEAALAAWADPAPEMEAETAPETGPETGPHTAETAASNGAAPTTPAPAAPEPATPIPPAPIPPVSRSPRRPAARKPRPSSEDS
ncbi:DUF3141 domain-containing protein [Phaeovulum vinaykumarii]|uniref:Poly(3-hydroxyalkanoate) synthetase n=1 Tax=Phaeovulum vinaykumarii TaxID=407234 RepID=A0A1N7K0E5_9RHOB|nr:DUF3141 domain-containing protein [Phaeovulum vinaykumarii]SIS55065.1 Protein of unknown function [Phaeovulum vinaykumarii]SOB92208.1 uncharacterized protein DUF3141 [Phaeovulum vinaykumarii]